jgi:anti-sigma B factor antagonist
VTDPHYDHIRPHDAGASDHAWFGVEQMHGCAVVVVGGEIDMDTAPRLLDVIEVAATLSPRLIIDLGTVRFLDSSGLNTFVRARRKHGPIALVHPPSMVVRLLQITRLDGSFTIHDRVEDAAAYLTGPRGA